MIFSCFILYIVIYRSKRSGIFHLDFIFGAGVRECPPWCSIVGATVTVHQFFFILHCTAFTEKFSMTQQRKPHITMLL